MAGRRYETAGNATKRRPFICPSTRTTCRRWTRSGAGTKSLSRCAPVTPATRPISASLIGYGTSRSRFRVWPQSRADDLQSLRGGSVTLSIQQDPTGPSQDVPVSYFYSCSGERFEPTKLQSPISSTSAGYIPACTSSCLEARRGAVALVRVPPSTSRSTSASADRRFEPGGRHWRADEVSSTGAR